MSISAAGPVPSSFTIREEGGGQRWMIAIYLALHFSLAGLYWVGVAWTDLLVCFLFLQVRGFCFSAGYHRLLAHRSFRTSRLFQFLLSAGGCMALRGGPLWWVAIHRFHHGHADTDEDVITPHKGLWWSYGGWLISGKHTTTDYTRVRDLARFPELRWLNRYPLAPALLLATATFLIGGWRAFLWGFCLSSVLLMHIMAALDAFVHLVGRKRFETGDDSRNVWLLSVIGMGEGWHNNHHHYPRSARQGFYWWEVDGTYTVLAGLAWAGVIWDVRTPPDHVLTRNLVGSNRATNEAPLIAQRDAPS